MSQTLTISPGNDEDILWSFASRGATGRFINSGVTVTMSLFAPLADPDTDDPIANADELSMAYVENSNGEYLGVLPSSVTATLTVGSGYHLRITSSGDLNARITLDVVVVERTS